MTEILVSIDKDDELFGQLTECYWCGLPTGGSHYCNEYCRMMDSRPVCSICGDTIEEECELWWDEEYEDEAPSHLYCVMHSDRVDN